MANRVEYSLSEELFTQLQKESYVTVATVDYEKHSPNVNALSWIYAPSKSNLRFAVDHKSRIVENIRHSPEIVITAIANGSTYSLAGKAVVIVERAENVPLKLSVIEMAINEVRDVMFYGAKIVMNPTYDKTYDIEAAAKLDRQVMNILRNA